MAEPISYRAGAFNFPSFPLRMVLISPNDSTDFAEYGTVRADEAGAVTFLPAHSDTNVTLNLAAGEYIPCLVRRVLDTGTDPIALHLSY